MPQAGECVWRWPVCEVVANGVGGVGMTSRFALIAAAGFLLCGAAAPANAADSGGTCCADLEARVAELEATTARKGNSKVSVQLYGQVSKALLIWDDGISSDSRIVDNTLASTRFGFYGKAGLKPGWNAGYNIELEVIDARADEVVNNVSNNDGMNVSDNYLRIRQSYWFLDSERFGRVSVGRQNTASSGSSEVVLGNSLRSADPNIGANFGIRSKSMPGFESFPFGRLNSSTQEKSNSLSSNYQWASDLTADRIESAVRYDSPSVYGFILSASWADNNFADVALRFRREFSDLRVAAAVSYQWDNRIAEIKAEALAGSISVMHMPTGLYGAFASGKRHIDDIVATDEYQKQVTSFEDATFWYTQAGIERKFLPFGSTTIYGEYGIYNSFYLSSHNSSYPTDGSDPFIGFTNKSEATRWGFGVNQRIESAAMDIYIHGTVWSFDDKMSQPHPEMFFPGIKKEDLKTIMVGSRIQF
jgi:predicted porin